MRHHEWRQYMSWHVVNFCWSWGTGGTCAGCCLANCALTPPPCSPPSGPEPRLQSGQRWEGRGGADRTAPRGGGPEGQGGGGAEARLGEEDARGRPEVEEEGGQRAQAVHGLWRYARPPGRPRGSRQVQWVWCYGDLLLMIMMGVWTLVWCIY